MPDPQPPLPFLPSWKNLKLFAAGLAWACLWASGPGLYELYDANDASKGYERIDWHHIEIVLGLGAAPTARRYWKKYRLLVSEDLPETPDKP